MKAKPVLFPRKANDGTMNVKIYVYVKGFKKEYISTPFHIHKREWDAPTGTVKLINANAEAYNANIKGIVGWIEARLLAGEPPSMIKAAGINSMGGSRLMQFAQKFVDDATNGDILRANSTQAQYKSSLQSLKDFYAIQPRFDFDTFDKTMYEQLMAHWRKQGKKINTIGTKVKFIKSLWAEARERNITLSDTHRAKWFKKTMEETDAIYLTADDMKKWVSVDLRSHQHLQQEHDRFLVSYYFLLRFGDSLLINEGQFQKINNTLMYSNRAEKTKDRVIIPVKPMLNKILKRNKYSFAENTNQEANWKLKEIGKLAKINDPVEINGRTIPKHMLITTHTARRSGATELYIASIKNGTPPIKMIMDLGGWKTEKVFKGYIRVDRLESAMMAAKLKFFK